jgi:Flp pilus assembly protein TadG
MRLTLSLFRNRSGAAAVEMALVTPLLLLILCGSVELGNYFLDEHALRKAVRDGARYAARQDFADYACSSSTINSTVVTNTQTLVQKIMLSNGTDRLANWSGATFVMSMRCSTTAGGQNMQGIYNNSATGAPVVVVSATLPYLPVLAPFGASLVGASLHATEEAAVMGI